MKTSVIIEQMIDNCHITITRKWCEDEMLYEATVAEFPDLTEYANTYEDAFELIIDSIHTTYKILEIETNLYINNKIIEANAKI